MTDQKVWGEEDILRLWPQTVTELRGFQKYLELKLDLTASRLAMALQLAETEFQRLETDRLKNLVHRCTNSSRFYLDEFGGDLDLQQKVLGQVLKLGYEYLIVTESGGREFIVLYDPGL